LTFLGSDVAQPTSSIPEFGRPAAHVPNIIDKGPKSQNKTQLFRQSMLLRNRICYGLRNVRKQKKGTRLIAVSDLNE